MQAGALWPFTPAYLSTPAFVAQLVAQLPALERASTLIETYYAHIAWLRCPVDHAEVTSELIPLFYPRRAHSFENSSFIISVALKHPHELAVIFALFALGAFVDLTQNSNNSESARYYMLARAALGLQSVFDHATLSACQTVYLLATYKLHAAHGSNQECSWRLASLGACLASSVRNITLYHYPYSLQSIDWIA